MQPVQVFLSFFLFFLTQVELVIAGFKTKILE